MVAESSNKKTTNKHNTYQKQLTQPRETKCKTTPDPKRYNHTNTRGQNREERGRHRKKKRQRKNRKGKKKNTS
ncbi:hypothetical protein, partial [Klebsiella aerogenes]|uniref:hypothetical protein n=1 Tax=Klebsiella aerogenes TaxID=548 RepID=UPI001CE37123